MVEMLPAILRSGRQGDHVKTYSLQYWNTNAKAWWTIEDNITSLTDESEICVMEWQATRHAVISSATRFRIVEVIEKPVSGFKLEKPE